LFKIKHKYNYILKYFHYRLRKRKIKDSRNNFSNDSNLSARYKQKNQKSNEDMTSDDNNKMSDISETASFMELNNRSIGFKPYKIDEWVTLYDENRQKL
jgi:hypothetical protein